MAVSDSQKVDLLYKQAFGVTKTDTSSNKSPSNESIASPLIVRGDSIWIESQSIPATAASVTNVVSFTGTNGVECVADNSTVPVSGVYPTWNTNLTNWINTEFGSSYLVKVYVDYPSAADPATTGTQIFAAGSGGTGEFYFNHSSGVLNFIGGTIPAALTSSKVLYIVGYRYVGRTGVASDWINTANVAETSSNLYYTNARVYANVVDMLPTYIGNIQAHNINISGQFSGDGSGLTGVNAAGYTGTTDAITEGSVNLFYTDDRVETYVRPNLESNLVLKANVADLTTANVLEDVNLYYTNDRVSAYLTPILDLKADKSQLNTTSITEGNKLFYTNARVYANVMALLPTYTGNINAGNINIAGTFSGNGAGLVGISAGTFTGNTDTVREGVGNLYYTNARVAAFVTSNLNLKANVVDLTTANVAELNNLYYTNARVQAYLGQEHDIIPASSAVYDLGSETHPFRDLWLSGNSIKLGNLSLSASGGTLAVTAGNSNTIALYTTGIAETGDTTTGNVFFTNARVFGAITNQDLSLNNLTLLGDLYVQGNTTTLNTATVNIEDKNLQLANGAVNATAADGAGITIDGANATLTYSVGSDSFEINKPLVTLGNVVLHVGNSTSDLQEGDNLYYTEARANAAIDQRVTKSFVDNLNVDADTLDGLDSSAFALDTDLTTANVAELNNLYYTNARVDAHLSPVFAAKANVADLTTANIAEKDNLYYTNARVDSHIQPSLDLKANVVDLTTSNVAEGSQLYYTNARVGAFLQTNFESKANVVDLTTANVTESDTALYYTNARVAAFVTPNLNLKANVVDLTTSNVAEGSQLYYTNARVDAWVAPNLASNLVLKANVVDLTTSNVAEGSQLYYTNARVRSALTQGTGVSYNPATGQISIGQDISPQANVTFATLAVTGNTIFYGNVTTYGANNLVVGDNMIYLNDGEHYSNPDLGIAGNYNDGTYAHAGFFRDASDGNWKVYDSYTPEPDSNIFIDTSHASFRLANIQANVFIGEFHGDVKGNIVGQVASISNFSTDDLSEGSNLYYTVARANAAIDDRVTKTFVDNLNINATSLGGIPASEYALDSDLTTANVSELNNLYYTNARVQAFVQPSLNTKANVVDLTTANITETNNLYYTNARVAAFVTPNLNLKANVVDLTTSNVAEGSQLYYTNARVDAWVAPKLVSNLALKANVVDLTTANIAELNNLFYTNARVDAHVTPLLEVKANVVDLTTSNVAEGSQLYYTNARVDAHIVPYLQTNLVTKANVVDLTTANIAELDNLFYTNARVAAFVTPNLVLKANVVDLTTSNVTEGSQLYYTNARVYGNVVQTLSHLTSNIIPATNGVYDLGTSANRFKDLWLSGTSIHVGDVTLSDNQGSLQVTSTSGTGNLNTDVVTANVWNGVYTANVIETTGNLYFTNARVFNAITNQDVSLNNLTLLGDLVVQGNTVSLNTATINVEDKNILLANGAINSAAADGAGITIDGAQANIRYSSSGDKWTINKSLDVSGTVTADSVTSTTWNGIYTANVVESPSALYYTDTRAYANLLQASINALADVDTVSAAPIAGQSLIWNGSAWTPDSVAESAFAQTANVSNTVLTIGNFSTDDLAEGTRLYYTNARVAAFVTPNLNLKANVVDLTTSNVAEGSKLYYTNARVDAWIAPNLASNLVLKANVVDLTTSNVAEGSQLYYTNSRVYSNVIGLFEPFETKANVALKANIASMTTANVVERFNLYYTNARVHANVTEALATYATQDYVNQGIANLIAGAPAVLDTLYELSEALGNDASFATTVTNTLATKADSTDLTTANVVELNNLYYTDARVYANVISLLPEYTGNVSADYVSAYKFLGNGALLTGVTATGFSGNTSGVSEGLNLYYTNARVGAYITPSLDLKANVVDLTTSNVAEGSQLYYTDARVDAWVAPNLASNLVLKANVVDLTTSNVAEGSKLYYTNTRVAAYIAPSLDLKANVVDLTTSNVAEGSQLYFTNSRVFDAITGQNVTINDLTLLGDLLVQGNTTVLNTATVVVEDKNILIANGAVSAAAADGAGITIMGANANILYRSTGDKFTVDRPFEVLGNLVLTQGTTTTDIPEGVNLYYSDDRVYSNVAMANISIFDDVDTINYPPQTGYVLKWSGTAWVANAIGLSTIEQAQLANVANTALQSELSNISNLVVSISNFSTYDLRESGNLYYTNARVSSNVISLLPAYTGNIKAGNVNVVGATSYANITGTVKVYQVYNEITNSLDTVFA